MQWLAILLGNGKGLNNKKAFRLRHVLINGATMADPWVDSYNRIQTSINQFILAGMPVPEYLLNGSHAIMFTSIECTNKDASK